MDPAADHRAARRCQAQRNPPNKPLQVTRISALFAASARRGVIVGLLSLVCGAQSAVAQTAPGIVAPTQIGQTSVPYPEGAHGSAEVVLELTIAVDGSVSSAEVRRGDPPFAEAARSAAEAFRFIPAKRKGTPVPARILVGVLFSEPLPPQPEPAPQATPTPPPAPAEERPPAPASPSAEPPIAEIQVLGDRPRELGSIQIPREAARRVPGSFGDPFRVVEILPGVAPVLSGLPYFFVRGSPPGSVGYFIDGIPVPLLFHVGSGPSVVAPMLIDRVDLFPSVHPARFGRYAGAILAGETAEPSSEPRGEAQARFFDASAAIEQPFAEGRGSVLVGGRYSYMQPLLDLVAPTYDLAYWDYQARLSYAVSERNRLSVLSFGGFDRLKNNDLGMTLFDVAFHRLDLRWDHARPDFRFRLAGTLSRDRVLAVPEDAGALGTYQQRSGARMRTELDARLSTRVRLRAGADVLGERVSGEREQVGNVYYEYPERTDLTSGAWMDVTFQPADGIELVPSGRFDWMRSRGDEHAFFEPRVAARIRLMRGLAYLAGFGLAHQLPTTTIRMPGRRSSLVEVSKQASTQATQGLEYTLPLNALGRTTLFHHSIDVDRRGVSARSYGVEQFVRRDFGERVVGYLSYTLSRAEGRAAGETNVSVHDRTHLFSAVLGCDLGHGFRVGGRTYVASGRAYAVPCPTADCGPADPTLPRPFVRRGRLPGFSRLDVRLEKRFEFESGFWLTTTFEWFNALLTREVEDLDWTEAGLKQDRQGALTLPSLGIELGY
ncbi:MAG TPA: energy transducer TonB [Polyangiaceae bacterium]|nr:energy transducer TonB [Polyangiaceae bacterium]